MQEISDDVSAKLGITLLYMYGTPKEIIENLREISYDPLQTTKKYPMLALLANIKEERGIKGIMARIEANMVIATLTDPAYKSPTRIATNFYPVLYPIYEQLLKSIAISPYYLETTWHHIEHFKEDNLYWGKQGLYTEEGNVFEDRIDAITINRMKLSIKQQC